MDRQTGLTTQQMRDAPKRAVFVWHNNRLEYPQALARKIGRDDLNIVSPYWLSSECIGKKFTGVVIDHAAILSVSQQNGLRYARARVLPNEGGDV